MSEKVLLNEELSDVVGGAGMSAAQFQRSVATLGDAELYSLISSMSESQLKQLVGTINDGALMARLEPALKASGNESVVAIAIKPTSAR